MASKVLRAVVLGPPGSGKGTVCERIARSFGLQHLSSGQFLRESLRRGGGECPGCPDGTGMGWDGDGDGRGEPRGETSVGGPRLAAGPTGAKRPRVSPRSAAGARPSPGLRLDFVIRLLPPSWLCRAGRGKAGWGAAGSLRPSPPGGHGWGEARPKKTWVFAHRRPASAPGVTALPCQLHRPPGFCRSGVKSPSLGPSACRDTRRARDALGTCACSRGKPSGKLAVGCGVS